MDTVTSSISLKPGDILLYKPNGFFGWLISLKTWHHISHVEIYIGNKESLASRDGQGVDRYPTRLSELVYVLRPTVPLNLTRGLSWFATMRGTAYGWLDLLQFLGLKLNGPGIVCSPFAAGFLRACGWNVFPTDPIEKVAPFQFLDLVGAGCTVAYGPL